MQAGQSATAYHRRGPIFRWALLVSNGKPRAAMKRFDVLGLGCAAVDDVLYVPSFPRADEKVRVARALRRCGGLTGAAMVTAARMGATCAFAGCLGTDESSQYVADYFVAEGIDVSHAPRLAEARVVTSTIVVGQDIGSRNIFYLSDGLIGAHEHLPPDAIAYKMRDPQWCLRQGEEIGSHCLILLKSLFEDHVLDNLRAAQGVVSLAKKYGAVRLEAACLRALAFNSPRYRTVKTILEKGLDHQGLEPLVQALGGAYTGAGRFCRNGREIIH